MIPYIAIGNDELEQCVNDGDMITDGQNEYAVKFNYSDCRQMSLLTVETVNGDSQLVGISGKLIAPWRPI